MSDNPVGLDGMEFIEYSGPDAQMFVKLFSDLGMVPIAQPERHLLELKKTPGGGKSRLFSVLWSDGHHVVGARAVQAGEHLAAGHPGEVVVDVGEGESIGCR